MRSKKRPRRSLKHVNLEPKYVNTSNEFDGIVIPAMVVMAFIALVALIADYLQ